MLPICDLLVWYTGIMVYCGSSYAPVTKSLIGFIPVNDDDRLWYAMRDAVEAAERAADDAPADEWDALDGTDVSDVPTHSVTFSDSQ